MKKLVMILGLILVLTLGGCSTKANTNVSDSEQNQVTDNNLDAVSNPLDDNIGSDNAKQDVSDHLKSALIEGELVDETKTTAGQTLDNKEEDSEKEDSEKENIDLDQYAYNPLTGTFVEKENTLSRPIVVMLDNQYSARPQAAISKADIVYEILAEGRITRYMAVFYGQSPNHLGPVRSARPYFIKKALEYNPYYIHVGGSMQALADVKSYSMADVDGLYSGAFWRESHKKIPHNMYTSDQAILKDGDHKGYNKVSVPSFLNFYETFTVPEGENASEIAFNYKKPTARDSVGYTTSYRYNNEENLYYRYTNNEPTLDENNQTGLTCSNIIVQYAYTKIIDNEGRRQIDLVGKGEGKLYTAGKIIPITWEKPEARSITRIYDANHEEVKLNPGVTWFQIVEKGSTETIK